MNKVLTPREARRILEEDRLEQKRNRLLHPDRRRAAPCYVYRNRADWLAGRYAYIM